MSSQSQPGNVAAQQLTLFGSTPTTVDTGHVGFGVTTATTATAGTETLPANPAGFLEINIGGTIQKIPYYNS